MSAGLDVAGRDRYLDIARGIAILLVCLLHAGVLTPGIGERPLLREFFARMGSGMQLFFVISGYLIARSWAALDGRPGSLRVFAAKRAAKILPLYLIVLHLNIGLFLVLDRWAPGLPVLGNSVHANNLTLPNYLAHWFFIQGVIPAWIHTLVDGSWSICAEVYFYLLFPLVLVRLNGSLKVQASSVAVACVAAELATYLLRKSAAGFSYYNVITQLPCMMMGALLYSAEGRESIASLLERHRVLILACCTAACLALWFLYVPGMHMVYAALFALAIGAARTLPASRLSGSASECLEQIGQYSYALFFAHLLVLKSQHVALRAWQPDLPFAVFAAFNLTAGLWLSALVARRLLHPIDRAAVNAVRRRLAFRATAAVHGTVRQE